jgi:membrane protein implicated in regulation of membrane protease activity
VTSVISVAKNDTPPLTDSAWFWLLLFSLVGLLALVAMSPKYGRRQANIERQYQARERVAEKITTENNPDAAARIDDLDARRPYVVTTGDKLIPIWPLAILLALVSLVAAVMLWRSHRGRVRPATAGSEQPGSLDVESDLL